MSFLRTARRPSWWVLAMGCLAGAGRNIPCALAGPPLPVPCLGSACGSSASSFVTYGAASSVVSGNTMSVTQSSNQAILNWASFNIANGYTVNFQQPSSTAEVLNKIWDSNPSVIAGALNANGEVYLYNQNGIVFGQGAQVDVGSLVASTLAFTPLNGDPDGLFKSGLLSENAVVNGALPAVFQASGSVVPGTITVSPGATLTTSDGGRIMLLGSAVTNQGTITTPDGQAILAAGNTVYLAASTDPSLRGLLIEINGGGTVTNAGQISAPLGNVTLAGMVVNQQGTISATTSVSANGSIYLVAGDTSSTNNQGAFVDSSAQGFGDLLPNQGGQLTLAPGSMTEVLPDSTDTGTITEENLSNFLPSQVDLVGQTVALLGNATVRAPGATVSVYAATDPYQQFLDGNGINTQDTGGEIYLDSDSVIDVSGLADVAVPVTNNVLQITLEGTDLQDDPLLRDGFLHGQTVTIDVSQCEADPSACSTLFNATPYVDDIAFGIDQMLTAAGTIQLDSTGNVIARAGSTLNVSGGSTAYQAGYGPSQTLLLADTGQVYNISDAPSTVQYVALADSYSHTDPTWGTTTKDDPQTYYAGYTQGANAGSIVVEAPQIYLRGTLEASTVDGLYQQSANALAAGGTLQIGCNCFTAGDTSLLEYQAPAVVFENGATDTLGSDFDYATSTLPADLQSTTVLSPTQLADSGFNHVVVYSNGAITLPAGTDLALAAQGALSLTSDQGIEIDGDIAAPGAAISLTTQPQAGSDFSAHDITLGAGADIDVSGTWSNDSPLVTSNPAIAPIVLDGGSVSLSADGNVNLGDGSSIDVSAGGWINTSNALTAGAAGAISLDAALEPGSAVPYTGSVNFGTEVALIGDSLSAGKGGALSITSGSVTIGNAAAGTPGELLLSPSFFDNQGFSSYKISGENDLIIGSADAGAGSVLINPVQETLLLAPNAQLEPTDTSLASFTTLQTLPEPQRSPVDLSFSASGYGVPDSGSVTLEGNASIQTDPEGSVTLEVGKGGSVTVLGSILAPAGDITLQIGSSADVTSGPDGLGFIADQQILLGPDAVLDAEGYAQIDTLDALGYAEGSILPGGTVSLQAYKGFVVTDPGSQIDVDGAAGVLDLTNYDGLAIAPRVVAGDAGTIDIDAREGLVLQGNLSGEAATYDGQPVGGAEGGSLTVGLDLYDYVTTDVEDAAGPLVAYSLSPRTLTLTSQPASSLSTLQSGVADISTETLESGGFDSITVKSADVIAVQGPVSLSAGASLTLDAPVLEGDPGASLQLTSPYVMLGDYYNGNPSGASDYFDVPTAGDGILNPNVSAVLNPGCGSGGCTATLSVDAQEIDIRGLSGWEGFASEDLLSSGDIRLTTAEASINTPPTLETPAGDPSDPALRAGLNVTGDLTLQAQQIYPTTNTDFTITAGSSVTVLPQSGTAATPLSAEGILTINAPTITQDGVLRAPLGWITLNGEDVTLGPGSVTSVSADGLTIPYGSTVNGDEWTYSADALTDEVITAPLSATVNLDGSDISVDQGATVDLSGGGDLLAYEWISGEGGSTDVLNPGSAANGAGVTPYEYAIVPALGSQFAAIDAQYDQGSKATGNQLIYLSGVPGLAPGYYALLPARYAELPGAYAIEVVKQDSNIAADTSVEEADGAYEVAARFGVAGTDIVDDQTSTVVVASNAVVNTQSQYNTTSGNTFFSSANGAGSAGLPADAGALQIAATASLTLEGSVAMDVGSYVVGSGSTATMVQGTGGDVSILAPSIEVVDSSAASTGTGVLQVSAQSLDGLGAQTIVLGAALANSSAGEQVTVGSTTDVELDNTSVALSAPQIILAAQDDITIDAGARIDATGTLAGQAPAGLAFSGGGALLQASSGGAVPLEVSPTSQVAGGLLSIGSQASLTAAGSLLLYASGNTTAQSDAVLSAPSLALYSSRVSLGDVPTGTSGFDLSSQLLSQLGGLTQLIIGSTSTIDFYGAVDLGTTGSTLQNLTLDAWAVDGYGAGNTALQAGSITLENTNTGAQPANLFASSPNGTGALTLRAAASSSSDSGQITLGPGDVQVDGFSSATLSADGDILAQGQGSLTMTGTNGAATPVSLQAAALTAGSASDETLTTAGAVTILPAAASQATLPMAPLGGELTIVGSSIAQDGTIDLPSGIVTLRATSGDVALAAGSVTSAAASSQDFTVTQAVSAAGQISLISDQGNVSLADGAMLDVAGASASSGQAAGNAGSLTVSAPRGQFIYAMGSTLDGGAPSGALQGNFTLDVASFANSASPAGSTPVDLSALTSMLSSSGFTGAVSLRTQTDSSVDVSGTITASSFSLTADEGSIDVSGVINTSGGNAVDPDGGDIALWAGNNLTLENGAGLLANAGAAGPTGANGDALGSEGGNITLGITSGTIDLKSGSTIQLLGSGGGSDGTLTLRAPAITDNGSSTYSAPNGATNAAGDDVAVTEIASSIEGSNPVIVEAYNAYDLAAGGTLSPTQADAVSTTTANGTTVYSTLAIGTPGGGEAAGVLFDNADALATAAGSISTRLTQSNPGLTVEVRPGIEIDGRGDVQVGDAGSSSEVWDLDAWNLALGTPVNLTLRAAGNLVFNASLSDGFTDSGGAVSTWSFGESTTSDNSASYMLTAGADLSSADPLAVVPVQFDESTAATLDAAAGSNYTVAPSSGNIIITPGSLIRTGDGNIDIAAGGDVLLGYSLTGGTETYDADGADEYLEVTENDPLSSVIYTAGIEAAEADTTLFSAPDYAVAAASYPTDGGDVDVTAAYDIRSAPSQQLVSDWLWRRGSVSSSTGDLEGLDDNTTWWIVFSEFNQGIGALGGGNVDLSAGGNIVNVSAVIPSTGRLLGAAASTPIPANLVLDGGGYLQVQAGGDIEGGVFEDDWGNATIGAGGALMGGATLATELTGINTSADSASVELDSDTYPILLMGSGDFDVDGRSGVTINFVGNSTSLPASEENSTAAGHSVTLPYFYTYSADSTLDLGSSGGDVVLMNTDENLPIYALGAGNGSPSQRKYLDATYDIIYPPTLDVTAASGDISILNTGGDTANTEYDTGEALDLYPSATGNLELLAYGSIGGSSQTSDVGFAITMYETDPSDWPNITLPLNDTETVPSATDLPLTPLHEGDMQPIMIVAETGDIVDADLMFPKQADVVAGGDIDDLDYSGKNLSASDVTLIEAGGDISYQTPTNQYTAEPAVNSAGITLAGPGYLDVLAGGTLDLGSSSGIVTSGNLSDSRLPSTGATLVVGAGFGTNAGGGLRQPAYQAFISAYLAPDAAGNPSAYASDLEAFMDQIEPSAGTFSYSAALSAFEALTPAQQLPFLAQILSDVLSATGLAHTLQGASYAPGYAAIDTLFPTTDAAGNTLTYSGDIDLFYSQIKTEQGGTINLLAPGGSVNVGVANPAPALDMIKEEGTPGTLGYVAAAANLGVLVLGQGAIDGFAADNFEVDTSRMLTLEGGNIILWASTGDIDAGKGAKSASGAPPPVVETDANGNVFVNPINDVSGSGIGQLLTGPGETAGLVNLIAPTGTVNAGDAGIRVAGNLNIAAVAVIGAGNITVAGTSSGVPTSTAGALAGALSGANALSDASASTLQQLTQDLGANANYQALTQNLQPTFIVVKLFCLGIQCEAQ